MAVLENKAFKQALIDYLEYKDLNDLSLIMKSCEFILKDTGQFTYRIWNQTEIQLDIRVPITLMKEVDKKWSILVEMCGQVYPDDNNHALMTVTKGMKINTVEIFDEKSEEQPGVDVPGGQVYENLISKVYKIHIDSIEKDYIIEACHCAQMGYRLAAATMIGCAAERLLYQLCKSYFSFLENDNGTPREIQNFEGNVLNAKKAHTRLDGFLRTTQNKEKMFERIGLENSNLHFSFLDIMRQVRNESGHPTGIKVSAEDLSSIFVNYQLLIERVHPVITKLPTYKEE